MTERHSDTQVTHKARWRDQKGGGEPRRVSPSLQMLWGSRQGRRYGTTMSTRGGQYKRADPHARDTIKNDNSVCDDQNDHNN
jgi:hypothetical protein